MVPLGVEAVQSVIVVDHQWLNHSLVSHLATRGLHSGGVALPYSPFSPHTGTIGSWIVVSIEKVVIVVPLASSLLVMAIPVHAHQVLLWVDWVSVLVVAHIPYFSDSHWCQSVRLIVSWHNHTMAFCQITCVILYSSSQPLKCLTVWQKIKDCQSMNHNNHKFRWSSDRFSQQLNQEHFVRNSSSFSHRFKSAVFKYGASGVFSLMKELYWLNNELVFTSDSRFYLFLDFIINLL